MKYLIEIVETLSREIEIEADTAEEAKKAVSQLYGKEEIVLTADDFKGVEFRRKYR
jgi:hypothetical protein